MVAASLGNILAVPGQFICRLPIADEQGRLRAFNTPFDEQILALDDFTSPGVETVGHLKPRQIGDTTVATAALFWLVYTASDPLKALIAANDDDATDSIFRRIKLFNDGLPPQLQRRLERSNRRELIFADTGAGIRVLTAGGKGHGRSFTFQILMLDEFAYWRHPEAVHASLQSTQHDGPYRRTWYISTPNGPGNLYATKIMAIRKAWQSGDPSVRFRFFRWADHRKYQSALPEGWEPDDDELKLAETHLHVPLFPGEDSEKVIRARALRQLAWRHEKIYGVKGIGESNFRREFPLTVEDGFSVYEGAWFDVSYLNEVLAEVSPGLTGEVRIYKKPQPGMAYAAGVDPAWCNGGDDAVCQILDEWGEQVAVVSTNFGGEDRFAYVAAAVIRRYKALTLTEGNPGGAGKTVLKIFRKEGVRLASTWDPATGRAAGDWTTGKGNKNDGYAHLRQVVNGDGLTLVDPQTIEQMMHIREEDGKLEGQDGYHDDHPMALMLAEQARQMLPTRKERSQAFRRKRRARPSPFTALDPTTRSGVRGR